MSDSLLTANIHPDRHEQLAEVAELYYLDGLNQSEIARRLDIDRSTVSRMLSDARRLNIVEVRVHHPLSTNDTLAEQLIETFGLRQALVLSGSGETGERMLARLGEAAARLVESLLHADMVVGLSWGTAVSAVVSAIQLERHIPLKIVQLVGALGAQTGAYDGHALLRRLAQKLDCEAYYLNAPFLVDSPEVAQALECTPSIQPVLELGRQSDLAIMGIGSIETQTSSFYQAGYVPLNLLQGLQQAGMVGDVCGRHFTLEGETPDLDFHRYLITIKSENLKSIPIRVAVAGGSGKVKPILGALRAGYVNVLITDETAAGQVLDLNNSTRTNRHY